MHIAKIILVLLTVGALALVPTVASAQPTTYTFDEADADWDDPGHWNPTDGPPGAGDRAVIPDNTICRITTANQQALTVDVQAGGELFIEAGFSLTVFGTVEDLETAITVASTASLFLRDDGAGGPSVIIFKGPDTNDIYDFLITGPGTFTAAGQTGRLEAPIGFLSKVVIDDGAKIEGSIEFLRLLVENNGTLFVSGSDDMSITCFPPASRLPPGLCRETESSPSAAPTP